jgi:hypothetical protein
VLEVGHPFHFECIFEEEIRSSGAGFEEPRQLLIS